MLEKVESEAVADALIRYQQLGRDNAEWQFRVQQMRSKWFAFPFEREAARLVEDSEVYENLSRLRMLLPQEWYVRFNLEGCIFPIPKKVVEDIRADHQHSTKTWRLSIMIGCYQDLPHTP